MGLIQPGPVHERVELAVEPEFTLGGMKVIPAELSVVVDGQRSQLQPRVMQVLVALAKARPAVVSRDKLIELCWDGRIVGDDALNRVVLALRHLAQQFSPQPFTIETVPRIGHRLVDGSAGSLPHTKSARTWRHPVVALAAAIVVAITLGLIFWQQISPPQPAAIAVRPFRDLSNGSPYFAEGISEEILSRLASEPQFRVAGSSSTSVLAANLGAQDIARRLDVDYVVEGAVRRQGERVRVNAHLVRATDGIRLWSESYDGSLDDIFAIQGQIGTAIARALRRKLVRTPATAASYVTDGSAYQLYLTARGLIRTRNRRAGPMAADLLRDALQIDKSFGPAWASLAEATLLAGALEDQESFLASVAEAQGYARHSVRLAPQYSDSHRTLGTLLGFGTPEAAAHLRRAHELDPTNAENMRALGAVYGAAGEFDRELDSYRRAVELDPFWFRAVSSLTIALAEMGDRSAAEAVARNNLPAGSINQHLVFAKIAVASGDYSEAIRRWNLVIRANSPRWTGTALRNRNQTLSLLRMPGGSMAAIPRPLDQRHFERILANKAPNAVAWQHRNRDDLAAAVYRDDNHVAAKLMLKQGRGSEIAISFDRPGGAIGIRRATSLRADQLTEVPIVALALRQAGRAPDANRLLGTAADLLNRIQRQGRVPAWFDAEAAALFAVMGKRDEALRKLERAFDRGWRHGGSTDLSDLADEPAFASLRGNVRFNRLRSQLEAHYARERQETSRLLAPQLA